MAVGQVYNCECESRRADNNLIALPANQGKMVFGTALSQISLQSRCSSN